MAQAFPDPDTVDPRDADAVYRHARARVDKDLAKGVVPSDDNVDGWLYLELRSRAVESVVDEAVTRLVGEQRVYVAGDRASVRAVVRSRGLVTRRAHNARKERDDRAYCLGYSSGSSDGPGGERDD